MEIKKAGGWCPPAGSDFIDFYLLTCLRDPLFAGKVHRLAGRLERCPAAGYHSVYGGAIQVTV